MSCPNNQWSGRHKWGPILKKCRYAKCAGIVGMHRRCAQCDCVQVGSGIPKLVRDQYELSLRQLGAEVTNDRH